jgi:hypothetical protein
MTTMPAPARLATAAATIARANEPVGAVSGSRIA